MKAKAKARPAIGRDTKAALRALRRAAGKVRAENRRLGLPLVIWKKGKTVSVPA